MLERRARLLLRAYPADYRRDRAEEIIGTLLEAAPDAQAFPSARDVRALIAGGVRARAAWNRRLSATVSLRLGLLLGLSIFVGFGINGFLAPLEVGSRGVGWLAIATGLLGVAAALAPWLGSRTAAIAIVVPAAALLAYEVIGRLFALYEGSGPLDVEVRDGLAAWLAGMLIAMGALVALSGGPQRLPRSWLWLPWAPLAALAVGGLLRFSGEGVIFTVGYLPVDGILVLAPVVACWLVTDARPALGFAAAAVLTLLDSDLRVAPFLPNLNSDAVCVHDSVSLGIGLAIMLLLGWLLRRQARSSSISRLTMHR